MEKEYLLREKPLRAIWLFALPMMAGVAAGCFSSQFIAPNLFGMWQIHKRNKLDAAKQKA